VTEILFIEFRSHCRSIAVLANTRRRRQTSPRIGLIQTIDGFQAKPGSANSEL